MTHIIEGVSLFVALTYRLLLAFGTSSGDRQGNTRQAILQEAKQGKKG